MNLYSTLLEHVETLAAHGERLERLERGADLDLGGGSEETFSADDHEELFPTNDEAEVSRDIGGGSEEDVEDDIATGIIARSGLTYGSAVTKGSIGE